MEIESVVDEAFEGLAELATALASDASFKKTVRDIAILLHERLSAGGILYTAGNGGSAAEAQHLSGEFVGRFRRERRSFGAVALTAESSAMTAIGNDYSFDQVFVRQLSALGKPTDVFMGLTTSGNSPNILEALKAAQQKGMATVVLLGKGGGATKGIADIELIVPSVVTARIQEIHLLAIHAICEAFDVKELGV